MKALLEKMLNERAEMLGRKLTVSLLGYGSTNRALLKLLTESESIKAITVRQKELGRDKIPRTVSLFNVGEVFSQLYEDVFFPSPSVRREKLVFPEMSITVCDYDLLFASKPDKLFAVSGSDGKSTTVAMTSEMLFPRFPDIFSGGNIGVPLWYANANSQAFLLELSSFTLRYSTPRGARALLTNVTPNHLDWHSDLQEYEDTKLSMIRAADEPILNVDDAVSEKMAASLNSFCLISSNKSNGEIRSKYRTEHTVTIDSTAIRTDGKVSVELSGIRHKERHNLYNLASAIALSIGYADGTHIKKVASDFNTLPQRSESFRINGVEYISSSIDTTPSRTRTTLLGLDKKVRIILGGRGKGLALTPLTEVLKKYAEKIAIYGEIRDELTEYIESDRGLNEIPHRAFTGFDDAMDYARDGARFGDTVLLSPAATGYGEFRDYKERGEHFKNRASKSTPDQYRDK